MVAAVVAAAAVVEVVAVEVVRKLKLETELKNTEFIVIIAYETQGWKNRFFFLISYHGKGSVPLMTEIRFLVWSG